MRGERPRIACSRMRTTDSGNESRGRSQSWQILCSSTAAAGAARATRVHVSLTRSVALAETPALRSPHAPSSPALTSSSRTTHTMADPSDLSALRIDRTPPPRRGMAPALRALLVLLAVLAAGFAGWRLSRGSGARVVTLGAAEATGGGSANGAGISANGYVVARTKASVSSKILGRLSWVGVTEGSLVRVNQVIARLESADYEAAVNSAAANVAQIDAQNVQAQRDLKRA